jgi:SAM-dependent methyltransferase
MNLVYLHSKNHPAVVMQNTRIATTTYNGEVWRGFKLIPSEMPQIKITEATRYHPFQTRPDSIGWYLLAGRIEVAFVRRDGSCWDSRIIESKGGLEPVFLPWALKDDHPQGEYDLTIHAREPAIILNGIIPDRQKIINLCVGNGVEIGPGSNARIKNSDTVRVTYLEETPAEEWSKLYNSQGTRKVNHEHWTQYVTGRAHDMPVEDGSLDFIFSCHVFEHLANPLGHLEVWAKKLKPGGQIVTIVPDYNSTNDWLAAPATPQEFLEEYQSGNFSVTREHHRRHAEVRQRRDGGEKSWKMGASIHVHAYSRDNTTALLKLASQKFNFRQFYVQHRPNFKEFYWRLVL